MNIRKSILYILSILFVMSSVSAISTTGLEAGYKLNSTPDDVLGVFNGTETLVNYVSGIINDSADFSASTNSQIAIGNPYEINDQAVSFSFWLNGTDTTTSGMLFDNRKSGGTNNRYFVRVNQGGPGIMEFYVNNNAVSESMYATTNVMDGNWHHIVITRDTDGMNRIFIDGSLENTSMNVVGDISDNGDVFLGKYSLSTSISYTEQMDEWYMFSRNLSPSDVSDLYNGGVGLTYPFSTPSGTPVITIDTLEVTNNFTYNATFNRYYVKNNASIVTNLSVTNTNSNVNGTYLLNYTTNASSFSGQYMKNELNNVTEFALPFEGVYKFTSSYFNNETETNSTGFFLFSDTTAPVIDVIGNITQNTYEVNFSTVFNVTDNLSGVKGCNLNITYLESSQSDSNFFINCTDTQTFTRAGLYNGFITATDRSGNIQTLSINGTVNPLIDISYINNATLAQIFNYSVRIFHPDGRVTTQSDVNGSVFLSPVNDGSLDLGNHTLEFNKIGYLRGNNTQIVNTTNAGTNVTFNAQPVTVFMRVYDVNTLAPLVFGVQMENATLIKTFTGLTNLSKTYQEVPTGSVVFRVNASGYSNGIFINTIETNTALTFDVYLTPINDTDIVTFTIQDFTTKNVLSGVLIEAQRVINDSRITVQQTVTGSSGLGSFLINNLEDYVFIFSKDGYTQAIVPSTPGVSDYNVRLISETERFVFIDGVNVGFFPQQKTINLNVTYAFTGIISGVSITQATFTVFDQNNNILNTQTSTNPTGTTFSYNKLLLAADNVTVLYINITYIKNGRTVTQSTQYKVVGDLTNELLIAQALGEADDEESKLWRMFIMLTAFAITIIMGNKVATESRDKVVALLLLPTILFTFVGWIPFLYGTVISIVIIVLYMGGNKR